ncbi:AI-2E family transporter [Shimazuella sp. AN120528]|uniref:AI-2E family transporter n=1 Tax=Shimazuella soli TaxID=1892854 RepID=UPI001F0D2562|nr:AI-2E family transporter [Shimazuella soli]MCH5585659.1 AI-2E family transporter [Shimazuella soli]
MPQTKFFRTLYAIIFLLLIVLLGSKVSFVFRPIVVFVQTLFFPFLISGVLFYLFRPIVRFMLRFKIPKGISILIIYLVILGLFVLLGFSIGPLLGNQFEALINNFPSMLDAAKVQFNALNHNPWVNKYVDWNVIADSVVNYIKTSYTTIGSNLAGFFGIVTNIILVFVTVPFILYYMLKEGDKAAPYVLRLLPVREREHGVSILHDLDHALSSYIKGQVLVAITIGLIVFIGYLIIGMPYALLLAIFAMFTNVIPYIGPLIGLAPAVIVASIHSPSMIIKVLVVAVIAQQVEGNFVTPNVMGKNLNIHPLTIILLLLVAGSLAGFLGMLLAIPTYAVLKVVVSHVYQLIRLRSQEKKVLSAEE